MLDAFFSLLLTILSGLAMNAFYDVLKNYFLKKIMNSESPYHYKKLLQALTIMMHGIKVLVALKLFQVFYGLGVFKPTKEQEFRLIVILAAILMVAVVAIAVIDKKKKLES